MMPDDTKCGNCRFRGAYSNEIFRCRLNPPSQPDESTNFIHNRSGPFFIMEYPIVTSNTPGCSYHRPEK